MKKHIALLLVLLLSFSCLAACNDEGTDSVTNADTANTEDTTADQTELNTDNTADIDTGADDGAKTEAATDAQTAGDKKTDALTEENTTVSTEAQTETGTEIATDGMTDAVSEAATDALTDAVTDAVTDAATELVTDVATDASTELVTDAATDASTELVTDAATDASTELVTDADTDADTDSGDHDEQGDGITADMSLIQALEALGFTGYRTDKLNLMSLYYQRFFVGNIPDTATLAREMKRLYDEYLADVIDREDGVALTGAMLSCYQAAVGDQYAVYLDEEEYADYTQDYNAEYVGIGVYLSYDRMNDTALILSVFENSPALEAGLLPGDYIVAVDDVDVKDAGYYGILDLVSGEAGSTVKITVERNGQRFSKSMVRRSVTSTSVTYRKLAQDATIGYIKIEKFDAKTAEQFQTAVDALLADGVRGFVFDLRNNPGGELNSIVSVLDYLLPDGQALVHFRYSAQSGYPTTTYMAEDGHTVNLPMVILCNEYTASAGELFTSAMRDYEAATVVGVTTYGKGTAQGVIEFHDGTAFTVSVARYDPPFGENYEGVGIVPDIQEVLSDQAAAINSFLRDDAIDNQLQKAVAELNRLAP